MLMYLRLEVVFFVPSLLRFALHFASTLSNTYASIPTVATGF